MVNTRSQETPVGLETRHVFLDTEVFRASRHDLNSNIMRVLGRYVEDGIFVLHTTDITLREVSRQIEAMESELTTRANKVVNDLSRWNNRYRFDRDRLPVPDPLTEPAQPSRAYRDFESILRHDWNSMEHRAVELVIGPVLDRYFDRQAPFDTKGGKEFPDAFALLALQNWCASTEERVYVVSKDKAMRRAADDCDCLIGIDDLECLFALVAEAQDHDFAETVSDAFEEAPLRDQLQDTLIENIGWVGALYDGDKYDAEVASMEIVELQEIESVAFLRVDQDQASSLVRVKLLVSAEIDYEDVSEAMWDNEDKRYMFAESASEDIQDSISTKVFIELHRDGENITLSSAQFIQQDLTVTDYIDPHMF